MHTLTNEEKDTLPDVLVAHLTTPKDLIQCLNDHCLSPAAHRFWLDKLFPGYLPNAKPASSYTDLLSHLRTILYKHRNSLQLI